MRTDEKLIVYILNVFSESFSWTYALSKFFKRQKANFHILVLSCVSINQHTILH